MRFRILYRNGSSEFLSADSAREAKEVAEKDFGSKVSKVVVVEDDVPDEIEEDEIEEDEEEDDDDR